jgi:hypothetical protein
MSVERVREVVVADAPLLEVGYWRREHPSLILTGHDVVARIGFQLHHPYPD